MSIKQWDDMNAEEKAEYLKDQLEHFINHFNVAISRTIRRIESLENKVESLEKNPA